ncbi:recombinase family protein [Agrobacterium fabrum]|uniref:recombinase family protein n=1 Tax=Agrobacterium fabrum TaxID=1176649 RepID=UPI0021CE484B|nr:recombinase family protein [Agrobacterium fabrum]UXT56676.1 recombinase family protein [Agrobacterium fabrum]
MQPKHFVAYYRVSTAKQGRSGLGLEAQRTAVAQRMREQPLAEFTEIESGRNNERPELIRAIEFAKANDAMLVIAKLDRLSRDVHFISGLLKQPIKIIACDIQSEDPFVWHMFAAVAEKEHAMIIGRIKSAIAEKRKQGVVWGSNKARTDAAAAFAQSIHADIQTLMDNGITTATSIAKALNERGIRTSKGGLWQAVQVQRLLKQIATL